MSLSYKKLDQVCEILDSQRVPITAKDRLEGEYPYYGANGLQDHVADYIFDDELVLLAEDGGNFGSKERPIAYRVSGKCWVNNHAHVLKAKSDVNVDYLCYSLMFYNTEGMVNGATRQKLTQAAMREMVIPYRNMQEQLEIVKVLGKVFHLIEKREDELIALDELVKSRFLELFGDPILNDRKLPTLSGENFFKLSNGKAVPEEKRLEAGVPAYGGNGISWYTDEFLMAEDTIVVGRVGFQSGNVHYATGPLWITDNAMYISQYDKDKFNLIFLCELMQHVDFSRFQDAGDLKKITQKPFMSFQYILPSMKLQQQFVDFKAQVDKSKESVKKSLRELETLKSSLMQQYFG